MRMICPKHKECGTTGCDHVGPHGKQFSCTTQNCGRSIHPVVCIELITEGDDMCIENMPKKENDMPEKPKYKQLKLITPGSAYQDGDINCRQFADQFNDFIQYAQPITLTSDISFDKLMEWAEQDGKRIKWLIENGYIEEVQSAYDKWAKEADIGGKTPGQLIEWAKDMPRD